MRNTDSCDARHRGLPAAAQGQISCAPGWNSAHAPSRAVSSAHMDGALHLSWIWLAATWNVLLPLQSCQSNPISSEDRRSRTKWETNYSSLSFALSIARTQGLSAIMEAWVWLSLAVLQLQVQMNWCSLQPTLHPRSFGIPRTNEPPSKAQTELNFRTIISNTVRCLVSPFQLSRTGMWHSSFIKQVFDAQRWHSK